MALFYNAFKLQYLSEISVKTGGHPDFLGWRINGCSHICIKQVNSFTFGYMNISNPFMQRCLQLAAIAQENGESAVGSVVVKDNTILGEGREESKKLNDVTRHAEVVAILDAIQKHGKAALAGATLYTNVEPCILCSYVIRTYKIAEVVYMKACGDLGGTNPSFPVLTSDAFASWQDPPKVTIYMEID